MVSQDKADLATEQMFALVGRAITEWSFVEQALCNIFVICVTPCPSRPDPEGGRISMLDSAVPTAVFYSVENFRGKLGMVDAALLARVSETGDWAKQIRATWARYQDKTRKLSLKRNRLAHWTVAPAFQDGEDYRQPELMPPYGSPGWWSETGANPPGNKLKPLHVEHLCQAFTGIEQRLRGFAKHLAEHPRLSDKYDRLTVRLIRTHDRLNPSRGERIRRDLASPE
jgi:hypothetical protein